MIRRVAVSFFLLLLSVRAFSVECDITDVVENYSLDFNDQFLGEGAASGQDAKVDLSGKEEKNCYHFARVNRIASNGLYNFDYTRIDFQGGDPSLRMARIVDDPLNEDNKVLETWVSEGWIGPNKQRGRVQLNLFAANYSYKKLSYSVRLMIPESFKAISSDKDLEFSAFSLGELFNKPHWTGEDYSFRIHYDLRKIQTEEEGESRFRLSAKGEMKSLDSDWEVLWADYNKDFEIPIGQWITLKVTYVEGDENLGLFTIKVARDGNQFENVIGFSDDGLPEYKATYNPRDSKPEGLRYLNPIKLYSNDGRLRKFRSRGIVARLFWDDLKLDPSSTITANCFIHCEQ